MRKESKFAIFEYEEQDKNMIEDLIEWLNKSALEVYDFFGVPFNNVKVEIKIFPNKQEFDQDYLISRNLPSQYNVPDYMIGCFNNNIIKIVSYNDYKNIARHKNDSFEYYKKTIVHEYVHFVNGLYRKMKNCSYTEKYLSEGIACYLSHQKENKTVKFSCSLEDLLNYSSGISYDNFYLLTKYLVESYDKNFVMDLFESNRQAREFLQSELYGKVKEEYTCKINENEKN